MMTVDAIHDAFANYLDSDNYDREVRRRESTGDGEPSLLDIVESFLTVGEGTLACPTFESLLIAIIAMTEEWVRTDRKEMYGSVLWPNPNTREARTVSHLIVPREETGSVHPILVRERFELEQHHALHTENVRTRGMH